VYASSAPFRIFIRHQRRMCLAASARCPGCCLAPPLLQRSMHVRVHSSTTPEWLDHSRRLTTPATVHVLLQCCMAHLSLAVLPHPPDNSLWHARMFQLLWCVVSAVLPIMQDAFVSRMCYTHKGPTAPPPNCQSDFYRRTLFDRCIQGPCRGRRAQVAQHGSILVIGPTIWPSSWQAVHILHSCPDVVDCPD
jgi:hypothetical protein